MVIILGKIKNGLAKGFVIASILFAILAVIAIPNFISYRGGPQTKSLSAVNVIQSQMVGVYDTAVIAADSAEDIDNWLIKNEFSVLSAKALPAVDDYIREGWRFFVAKLDRDDRDGAATPHPILLQFPVEKPVYPMRLTALAASRLQLDLYVVAAQEALPAHNKLIKEYCNTFTEIINREAVNIWINDKIEYDDIRFQFKGVDVLGSPKFIRGRGGYRNGADKDTIGHKAAAEIMWDGCVVTKLAGELTPADMRKDTVFDFVAPTPFRVKKVSQTRAVKNSFFLVFLPLIPFLWLAYGCDLSTRSSFLPARILFGSRYRTIASLLLIGLTAVPMIYFLTKDKVSVRIFDQSRYEWDRFTSGCSSLLSDPDFPSLSIEEINTFFKGEYPGIHNPYTGAPVIVGDSPGNLSYVQNEEGIFAFAVYDRTGAEVNFDGTHTDIQHQAMCAVSETCLDYAVNRLLERLNDPRDDIRQHAAIALGKLGHEQALDALIDMLADSHVTYSRKATACAALGDIGNQRAIDTLVDQLNTPAWFETACVLGRLQDARCLRPLAYALHNETTDKRNRAIKALTLFEDNRSVEIIISALKPFQHQSTRRLAIGSLGKLICDRAVDPLIAVAVTDPDPSIRNDAIKTLGMLKNKSAVKPLVHIIDSPQIYPEWNRRVAIENLVKFNDPDSFNSIVKAMQHDFSNRVRVSAARALAETGDVRAAEPFIGCVKNDPDDSVRAIAVSVLGKLQANRLVDDTRILDLLPRSCMN